MTVAGAMVVGALGVAAGYHDSPRLAGVLLLFGAAAGLSFAVLSTVEAVEDAAVQRRARRIRPHTKLRYGQVLLAGVSDLVFVVGPLVCSGLALWYAVAAFRNAG